MQQQLGAAFPDFEAALAQPAPVSIRLNPRKPSAAFEAVAKTPVAWAADGFYLPERPNFTLDPLLHAGAYYVQEASSMFLAYAFRYLQENILPKTPLTVVDLCAAPGGKSTLLLSLLGEEDLLIANEVIKTRANILAENICKWGRANALVTQSDPKDLGQIRHLADVLIVDAPCSGEGMFRKDPNAISEWSAANVQLCSQRQQRILADVWEALKPGGVLIYSTCTFNEAENEDNVLWTVNELGAQCLSLPVPAEWAIAHTTKHGVSGYKFLPHRTQGEGLFMAILQKQDEQSASRTPKISKSLKPIATKDAAGVDTWLNHSARFALLKPQPNMICALPERYVNTLNLVQQYARVIQTGVEVAELTPKGAVPQHGLAMCIDTVRGIFPETDCDTATALAYLHRETPYFEAMPQGWNMLTFGGLPLGFVKRIGQRINNYYPAHWRIRMDIE